jgi:hypothetical protein
MIKPWGPHAVSALWCQLKRCISSPCWVLPPVPIPKSLNLQTRKLCQRVQFSWTMDGWRPRLRLGSSGRPPSWWDGDGAYSACRSTDGGQTTAGFKVCTLSLRAAGRTAAAIERGRYPATEPHRPAVIPDPRTGSIDPGSWNAASIPFPATMPFLPAFVASISTYFALDVRVDLICRSYL